MEIGSFIELDLRKTGEHYDGNNVVRLNSGRAGILHALRVLEVNAVYIPYYQCPSVAAFLIAHNIEVRKYFLTDKFEPVLFNVDEDAAVLIVNYFGVISSQKIELWANQFKNVIIDNSQAFFSKPLKNHLNIYSPRKFFGVPDGSYVIGDKVENSEVNYPADMSSDTAGFLFKRIEKGCNAAYAERMMNEERINNSDVLQMSKLTTELLKNVDYDCVAERRLANFKTAHALWGKINKLNPAEFINDDCVPMVYPLVLENDDMVKILTENQIYTGRWWNHVLTEVPSGSFESYLSRYMIPVPIDQRYDDSTLSEISRVILNSL